MRKVACKYCETRAKSICRDLDSTELQQFRSVGESILYKQRQVIYHEGAVAQGFYVLCHGAVKLYQSDRFGRDHILGLATPGEILGEVPEDPPTYSTSAEALTEAQLRFMPRQELEDLIRLQPVVGFRLIQALSSSLNAARRKLRSLVLKDAESRMAELLLQLAQASIGDSGNGVEESELNFSRRDLGDMIGVSTETAIRLLGQLRRKGLVKSKQKRLTIADAEGLTRVANRDELESA
jgi:CRP-like cAMP-binding protein